MRIGYVVSMRKRIEIEVAVDDRARLEAIVADRNCRQKHVERVRIVLLTADGVGTLAIMRQVGSAKATVWRWQERFATEGVARAAARQEPAAGQDAAAQGGGRAGGQADARRAAG